MNFTKVRLTDHVVYRTGTPHDREVSSLISAMTNSNYDAAAHLQWRHKYADLLDDLSSDPEGRYTVDPPATIAPQKREEIDKLLEQSVRDLNLKPYFEQSAAAFLNLLKARNVR